MSNYFDPDSILSEREAVPIRFTTNVFQGAPLRQHCLVLESGPAAPDVPPTDLTAHTRLHAPVWLARSLHARGCVHAEVPPAYHPDHTRAIKAPGAVGRPDDGVTEYYYDVGAMTASMLPRDDRERMLGAVLGVYQQRYYDVVRGAIGGMSSKRLRCVREGWLSERTAKHRKE
eukprot:PhM_4_TR2098/c2_g3_i2/m.36891/K10734/GINS3; GINS complex subunit 3